MVEGTPRVNHVMLPDVTQEDLVENRPLAEIGRRKIIIEKRACVFFRGGNRRLVYIESADGARAAFRGRDREQPRPAPDVEKRSTGDLLLTDQLVERLHRGLYTFRIHTVCGKGLPVATEIEVKAHA